MRRSLFCFFLLASFLTSVRLPAQHRLTLDLEEAIATAHDQSPAALLARHTFLTSYWEYRSYRADQLPALRLTGSVGQYNRSLVALQDAATGAFNYVGNNTLNNSLSLSLNQNITLTGGTVAVSTGLGRLDQFAPESRQTWNSNPVYVSVNQPISAYNSFRWEKKIEPRKYELAKRAYAEALEAVTVTVSSYFFDLLLAQRRLETARASRENTAQLYAIAQERFRLGSLSRDEVLQLELKLLGDDLTISDCAVQAQMAMMRLRNYLGYNETVELLLLAPEAEGTLMLSYDDVLGKVLSNSSTTLDYELRTLSADRAVAQAKAAAGLSANLSARFGLNQVGNDLPAAYRHPLDQEVVGLTLSMPILDWGKGRGRVKVAQSPRPGEGGAVAGRGRRGPDRAGAGAAAGECSLESHAVQPAGEPVRSLAESGSGGPRTLCRRTGTLPVGSHQRDGTQYGAVRNGKRRHPLPPGPGVLVAILLRHPPDDTLRLYEEGPDRI